MALQFQPPPDWLIQDYMNRKSPVVEGLQAGASIAQIYMQEKARREQMQLKQREDERQQGVYAHEYNPAELPGAGGAYNQYSPQDMGQVQPGGQTLTGDAQMRSMLTQEGGPATLGPSAGASGSPLIGHWNSTKGQGIGMGQNTALAPAPQNPQEQANLDFATRFPQGSNVQEQPRNGSSLERILAQKVANGEMTLEDAYKQKSMGTPVSYQVIGTQDGSPVGVNPKTLQTVPIKLPGKGPLTATNQTEGQANAKLYAQRMEEADKQLITLGQSTDLASAGSGLQRIAPNVMQSGNIQLVEQAQRNFLNAVLRRESGAVISPTEFSEGKKQYFEVFGDTPGVKKQKAMNRITAIAGLKNAAGGSMESSGVAGTGPKKVGRFIVEEH